LILSLQAILDSNCFTAFVATHTNNMLTLNITLTKTVFQHRSEISATLFPWMSFGLKPCAYLWLFFIFLLLPESFWFTFHF